MIRLCAWLLVVQCSVMGMCRECSGDSFEDAYCLDRAHDMVLIGGGMLLIGGGMAASGALDEPDPSMADRSSVWAPERFATRHYSESLSDQSDYLRIAALAMTVVPILPAIHDGGSRVNAAVTSGVIVTEVLLITGGLTELAKGLSARKRPYFYNDGVPDNIRADRDAAQSFWSGHASISFAAAVCAGSMFQARYPGSEWVIPVWASGLALATGSSILRVSAGEHFPSDVVAGALIGAVVGWYVPRLHRTATNEMPQQAQLFFTGSGLAYSY